MAQSKKRKNILEHSHSSARQFFLNSNNYCTFDLPPYISFKSLLKKVDSVLKVKKLSECWIKNPKLYDKINHTIFHNKDGKYAWRPIQLIHPALYVSLIHVITEEKNWEFIRKRLSELSEKSGSIKCMSWPIIPSEKSKKNKKEQILHWWEKIEQKSIELSLDWNYLTHIDISNCYGSLYTHSIAWALHGRKESKKSRSNKKKNKKKIGNIIDEHLMQMSYGQTNGISQGSVLMDFVAEIVLAYIDWEISEKIKKAHSKLKYKILRYRDDYRIFTESMKDGEEVVKHISEILVDYGMTLNPNKTKPTDQLIEGSIKSDKLYWIRQKRSLKGFQKHLLLIHNLSMQFPHSGSLITALTKYYNRIQKNKDLKKKSSKIILPLISIVSDIAYRNPRTYPISMAIISKLLSYIKSKETKKETVKRIKKKFEKILHTGHLDIWLQRAVIGFKGEDEKFEEPICKIVSNPVTGNNILWDLSWLKELLLKKTISSQTIIDAEKLTELSGKPISEEEVSAFKIGYYP